MATLVLAGAVGWMLGDRARTARSLAHDARAAQLEHSDGATTRLNRILAEYWDLNPGPPVWQR